MRTLARFVVKPLFAPSIVGASPALIDGKIVPITTNQLVLLGGFVPFAVGRPTAAQRLVLFEDAKVFHRTPLTAYALRDLQASRQRPMARFVLYGSSGAGDAVGLSVPAHAAAMTDVELALPTGLRRFVEDYAAQPGVSRTKALDAYVAGDSNLVRHLVAAQASVAE